jgi:hypothetical protein
MRGGKVVGDGEKRYKIGLMTREKRIRGRGENNTFV